MKEIRYMLTGIFLLAGISSCKNVIDLDPVSNEVTNNYYHNYYEVNNALTGCYNGLQAPLITEWMLTELRTDNSKQGTPNSKSNANIELNAFDMYTQSSQHQQIYNYWISVYRNLRSINYVLKSLGVSYDPTSHQLVFGESTATMTDAEKTEIEGQALFLRAYHYFNLVRLFGGVFLLTEPVVPSEAKQIGRSTVDDCYQLIMADLLAAAQFLSHEKYQEIPSVDLGRANAWSAKGLLAKVYLTLGRPADALPLLNDIISNSGYGLESSYSRVFSISNEMNKEILFAVRYKAGSLGLGNPMANYFAPTGSGDAIVNGDGSGYNYPTTNLSNAYKTPSSGPADSRKAVVIGTYGSKLYAKKFWSEVQVKFDAENDFPVLRFADILLMKAEATGFDGPDGTSVAIINQIRERAGAGVFTTGAFTSGFYKYPVSASDPNAITDQSRFVTALLDERRLEFVFENQRFFDLVRTGQLIPVIQNYYSSEYSSHYKKYIPAITLAELQANVTSQRLLLPIPQKEIDTNDQIHIEQNPGY